MIVKITVVGIVVLTVITLALMPSPGSLLHPQAETKLTLAPKSTEIATQIPAQNGPTSEAVSKQAIQTSTRPSTAYIARTPAERFAGPVYTNVTIIPENVTVYVNQTFSVNIWINNVTDMAGWQIELYWNREIIKCVKAQVNTPPEWGGLALDFSNITEADVDKIDPSAVYDAWQFGSGIDNTYSATQGRYDKAECRAPRGSRYHQSFNGSIAAVTLTFQALQPGSTSLSLWRVDYNSATRSFELSEGIIIGDGNANEIANAVYRSYVEVQAP